MQYYNKPFIPEGNTQSLDYIPSFTEAMNVNVPIVIIE